MKTSEEIHLSIKQIDKEIKATRKKLQSLFIKEDKLMSLWMLSLEDEGAFSPGGDWYE